MAKLTYVLPFPRNEGAAASLLRRELGWVVLRLVVLATAIGCTVIERRDRQYLWIDLIRCYVDVDNLAVLELIWREIGNLRTMTIRRSE